jgi:hypothetical protein
MAILGIRQSELAQLPFRFGLLLKHDLFRKPVSTFRDHALGVGTPCDFGF